MLMKIFDSGMPEEAYWNSLFDLKVILSWLNPAAGIDPIVEIGCGYGTFTVPIAQAVTGSVHAFDIDPEMIRRASSNVRSSGLENVVFHLRDVLESGTGLPDGSARTVLLFNILHSEHNRLFLEEAGRILRNNGSARIIHWRKDIETPRGPRQDDRPDMQSIIDAADGLDLHVSGTMHLLEPYHWGMQLNKGGDDAHRDRA
jgi:SAM-dependent methyltransferase